MSTSRIGNQPSQGTSPSNVGQDYAAKTAEAAQTAPAAATQSPQALTQKKPSKGNYDVNISSNAKDRALAFQKALDIAKATPDIREDKVNSIKERIQNGTYKVDAGDIADSMLREAVKEHLANTDNR